MSRRRNIISNRLQRMPARTRLSGRPPRDILIAATLIIAIAAVYGVRNALPTITYWLTPAPSEHAGIVPDDASLFVSVDLLAARHQATSELRNSVDDNAATPDENSYAPEAILRRYTGLDWHEHRPDSWAGREMSLTVNSDATYVVIVDIRDRREAAQYLGAFLSDTPQNLSAALLTDYLVVANDDGTAQAVIKRADNPVHNTLAKTADYREAIAIHDELRPLATVFLRWTLAQGEYTRSHAGAVGCHPRKWLTATLRAWEQRLSVTAYCPPSDGIKPPATLTVEQARPKAIDLATPAFWLANSFTPDTGYIGARTANTGIPGYTLLDYFYGHILAPTTAGIDEIQASVLQHLKGHLSLTIAPATPGQPPPFRANLSVRPDGVYPLTETVDHIATAMAAAYGIETARHSGEGWQIRHPNLPDHDIEMTIKDNQLTIAGDAPDRANPAPNNATLPGELPHPYQTVIYASAPYAPAILAAAFTPFRTYSNAIATFAYSAYNDGSMLRHRLHINIMPPPQAGPTNP